MADRGATRARPAPGDQADQVRALFDLKAANWPAKYAADGALTGRLALLASTVRDLTPAGGEILDLGCGSGELARALAADGYLVTGCDIAPAMIGQARQADGEHAVQWIELPPGWEALPRPTASLDAVVAASVLEYVRDPAAVLAECARVLRPGGVLLCTVPNMAHPVRWLEWLLRLAARGPAGTAALTALANGGTGRRAAQYQAYLRISCQRRRISWWHAAGRHAGLEPVPVARPRRPLVLLILARPADRGGPRPTTPGGQCGRR
jgi:2-polyprenyl-3-methyl-5-hydroxy-6-metoxy-1,4-benzoquinol methylase